MGKTRKTGDPCFLFTDYHLPLTALVSGVVIGDYLVPRETLERDHGALALGESRHLRYLDLVSAAELNVTREDPLVSLGDGLPVDLDLVKPDIDREGPLGLHPLVHHKHHGLCHLGL